MICGPGRYLARLADSTPSVLHSTLSFAVLFLLLAFETNTALPRGALAFAVARPPGKTLVADSSD